MSRRNRRRAEITREAMLGGEPAVLIDDDEADDEPGPEPLRELALSITVNLYANDLDDTMRDVAELAARLGCGVDFNANGITMTAFPDSTAEGLLEEYRSRIESRRGR